MKTINANVALEEKYNVYILPLRNENVACLRVAIELVRLYPTFKEWKQSLLHGPRVQKHLVYILPLRNENRTPYRCTYLKIQVFISYL